MSAATATASTAIIIALLITALFIFIFYPSPILFGKLNSLPLLLPASAGYGFQAFQTSEFATAAKEAKLILPVGISIKPIFTLLPRRATQTREEAARLGANRIPLTSPFFKEPLFQNACFKS
jgi:hypothetical protein